MASSTNRFKAIPIWVVLLVVIAMVSAATGWYLGHRQIAGPEATRGTTGQSSTTSNTALETAIQVVFTPAAATVQIDGTVVQPSSDNRYYVWFATSPGDHNVSVTLDGFTPFSMNISLEEGDVYPLWVTLSPNTADTMDYYDTHVADQVQRDEGMSAPTVDLASVEDLFPVQGNGFVINLEGDKNSSNSSGSYFQVNCDLSVLSRLDCKSAARDMLSAEPYLLTTNNYVFVFIDV